MKMRESLERLVGAAARRPLLTLAIVAAAALAGGLLALGLSPDTGDSTFVNSSSPSFRATTQDQRHFGGDPVVVLIREPLTNLVETKDLGVESELEACLAGQQVLANQTLGSFTPVPSRQAKPFGGWNSPCGALMKYHPVEVVYGPGTFLNRAVAAVNSQVQAMLRAVTQQVQRATQAAYHLALARHLSVKQAEAAAKTAGRVAYQEQVQQLEQAYLNSGISGMPRIDDTHFIQQIVFDPLRGVGQPKARFSYLFPTANSGLIQARLRPDLTPTQRAQAIAWIRSAVKMPLFHLRYGGTYTVSGVPVVINDLGNAITGSIAVLLVAALLVMGVTLRLVFRSKLRLLPLAIALAAVGITFGATALVGGSLTMASIAVLPILIGLAVDYAIQFQSRTQEELRGDPGDTSSPAWSEQAVARAAGSGAPAIVTAAAATATGFLILLLSPVPMVRGFGVLLVVGIAVALLCALTMGAAAMVLAGRRPFSASGTALPGAAVVGSSFRGAGEILGGAFREAGEILQDMGRTLGRLGARVVAFIPRPRPGDGAPRGHRWRKSPRFASVAQLRALPRATARATVRKPGRVLALGLLLAALGWVADTQTSVQSDVTKLVPSSMPALRDLHTLEQVTGVSGEIDVEISSQDVATPRTIGWMVRYENTLLSHFGYAETKGCSRATLCPALSLPDLFCSGQQAARTGCGSLSSASIDALLAAVPPYFKRAVITPDRREASLAFGIRLMPLARQQQVIAYMRSHLRPPPGVTAELAGVPVLAAQANADLSSVSRRLLTLVAGLLAVGLVLLAIFRQADRALVPLIPIVLATGWSALIVFLIGIPLNPLSAALGALVIAVSTEFSVLLSERFRQERTAGHDVAAALARTYRSTGRAVLASGITAIAGFGVLVFSNITMLRDFGFVTLIDLSVSLTGVLLILPAVLTLSERGQLAGSMRTLPGRVRGAMPRLRRRARMA
jgi:hydrophobe/amphiphile efflux-3 (HAE3) family protein